MEAILNGPSGRTELGPTPLTIGRTADNQLVVNDPKASSHHAEVHLEGQGYSLIDLGSTNGTFINEQRINPNVPCMLSSHDTIRIGDTVFSYEVTDPYQPDPTVYANYNQGNAPGYTPTVAAPSSFTGYGSDNAPPLPPPPPDYPYAQPQQGYAPPSMNAQGMPGTAAIPGYAAPAGAPVQRRSRRRLWIILGIVGGVLLLLIILFAVIGANASTPTKTLNAFCNALKSGDYPTAYNQLSSGLQKQFGSESEFALVFSTNGNLGKVTDCSVSNVNDSAGSGTINYTFSSGNTLVDDYVLIQENNTWKINDQHPRT